MQQALIFSGMQILHQGKWLEDYAVVIRQSRIERIVPASESSAVGNAQYYHFPGSCYLAPGLMDLHIHGANGCDVMDATEHALQTISQALLAEGVTGFLATTMAASSDQIEAALSNIAQVQSDLSGAVLLGVHLEGPFLSKNQAGAQSLSCLQQPDVILFKKWHALSNQQIKIVTLAPELPQAHAMITYLKQQGVCVSLGHSDATYEEALLAIESGASHITHLFNAMCGLHHREPGLLAAALLDEAVYAELIADGVHLHPAILKLAHKLKGSDHLMLVSDAMRAKCLGDGQYDLAGQSVTVRSGEARLPDGRLAGSTLTMPQAIKNMHRFAGCSLAEAIHMASAVPAKQLGLSQSKGSIQNGMDADLVVFDAQLNVLMTIIGGKVVFNASS